MGKTKEKIRAPGSSRGSPELAAVKDTPQRGRGSIVPFVLAVLVAVTPLGLLNGIFISHDVMPKVVLILCGAAILLFVGTQWIQRVRRLWGQTWGKAFLLLVAGQFVSLTASTAVSGHPSLSFAGVTWRRFGWVEQAAVLVIALAAAAWTAADRSWLIWMRRAVSVCGALAALYACLQFFGVDPFLDPSLYRLDYLGGIARPPATMGSAIYFGSWMAAVTVFAASSFAVDPHGFWKRVHVSAAAIGFVSVILSGSRGSALAVVIAGALLLFERAIRDRYQGKFALAAVVLSGSVVLLAVSPAGEPLRHRFRQWFEDPGGPRLAMWKETASLIATHPLLGTGPETFGEEFRVIQSEALSRAYPDFFNETPHNVFLDAATGEGIPGVLILCGLICTGIFAGRSQTNTSNAGFAAALVALAVAGLFASLTIVSGLCLWCIAGIAAACSGSVDTGQEETPPAWSALLGIPAVMFLVAALVLAAPDAVWVRLAEAVSRKDAAQAEEIYRSASRWNRLIPFAGYDLYGSRELAILARSAGNTPEGRRLWAVSAEAAASAERSGEERASAAYQSAVLSIANGNLAGAESETRKAIALAPNWYKPHLFLAQILAAYGRTAEAAAEQQRGVQLAGAKSQADLREPGNQSQARN